MEIKEIDFTQSPQTPNPASSEKEGSLIPLSSDKPVTNRKAIYIAIIIICLLGSAALAWYVFAPVRQPEIEFTNVRPDGTKLPEGLPLIPVPKPNP